MKTIESILSTTKKKKVACVLVQGRVPTKLRKAVRGKLKKNKITWNDFVTACCTQFVEKEK